MSRVAAAATCLALDIGFHSGYPYFENNKEVTMQPGSGSGSGSGSDFGRDG